MKKISENFHGFSTGWVTLGALVVFVLFTIFVLPGQSEQADASGGAEVGSPDLSFFYTTVDLYEMAEAYAEEGRAAYIRARFSFDLVWPVVYAAFLVTSISWLSGRAFHQKSGWQFTNLVPFWGMIFDFLENISASLVMCRYPLRTPVVDFCTPWFTLVKWILVAGSFGLLIVAGLAVFWQWFSQKSDPA